MRRSREGFSQKVEAVPGAHPSPCNRCGAIGEEDCTQPAVSPGEENLMVRDEATTMVRKLKPHM